MLNILAYIILTIIGFSIAFVVTILIMESVDKNGWRRTIFLILFFAAGGALGWGLGWALDQMFFLR